ncbi:ATP-binding protein [Candidatus Margulisiibacteriota bacterium]
MLSTLTIISIFTEIFASGILMAGAAALIKKYFSLRRLKDLFFSLVFFSFFVYVAATIASQIMFNFGRDLRELILIHKGIAISIIFCSLFLWSFMIERFGVKKIRWVYALFVFLAGFWTYRVLTSSVNLVYREGIIEPIVYFSQTVPVKSLFALVWLLLAVFSLIYGVKAAGGKRVLSLYLSAASFIMLIAMSCSLFYLRFGEAGYLVASWISMLVAALGFLLAEIIPEESPEAKKPLQFFKTRILFKLMLIFVLLIVILFETTTLAFINISKDALSQSIIRNYLRYAENFASNIRMYAATPSLTALEKIAAQLNISDRGVAFVVDREGKLVSHPDGKRAAQRENLSQNEGVARLLNGEKGGGEFKDELGGVMVGAYVPIDKFGWGVIVQEPIASAYYELRKLESNALIFVIVGIILTVLVGIFFARSIERPIKELTFGTEAVARGDLHWNVSVASLDEIGRLTTAFNQMTKELRESQERLILSEKLASLGTMAAGMAHEIKNPLVSIRTFTQILQQKWEDPEFRKKFSSLIPVEIERINRIAESLLKFGKPMKPELSRVEVNSLLEEVLMLFESQCKKHNIRVTKKLAELPEITGDAGQLQQVFVNIIKNAIEAMQKNGGELIVKTDLGEVIRLGKIGREGRLVEGEMIWGEGEQLEKPVPVVFIEITDSGEGIPEENLKSLFDPFFTTKMTGTGMGLPITLRIVEEHKGSVKVRSEEGRGTTFIMTLPQGG